MKKILSILLSLLIIAGAASTALAFTPADGTYSTPAWWEGGTGRAAIASPVTVTVNNGSISARIVLTSSNYTWMETQGVHVNNENPGGNSTFTIPVPAFDTPFAATAETTAMSEPHTIDYSITVSSEGVAEAAVSGGSAGKKPGGEAGKESGTDSEKPAEDEAAEAETDKQDEEKQEEVKPVISVDDKKLDDENTVVKINKYSTSTSVTEEELQSCEGKSLHVETSKGSVFLNSDLVKYLIENSNDGITLTLKEDKTDDSDAENLLKSYTFMIKDGEDRDVLSSIEDKGKTGPAVINIPVKMEKVSEVSVKISSDEGEKTLNSSYDGKILKLETEQAGEIQVLEEAASGAMTAALIIAAAAVLIAAIAVIIKRKKK